MEHWGEQWVSKPSLVGVIVTVSSVRGQGTTYTSEQLLLQLELASIRAQLLDRLDNLRPASDMINCKYQTCSNLDRLSDNLRAAVVASKDNNVVFRHDVVREGSSKEGLIGLV